MSSENLLNEVIVSLMATQNSMKESLKEMSQSMKLMKTEMERFKGLDEQVDSLKAENKDLKEKLDTLLKEKQGSIDFDRVPSHALFATNPFPKGPGGEYIPHPVNGKEKLQFSKRLFRDLIEQVHGEEISQATFNTIWDEVVFKITPSLIKDLKQKFNIDEPLTFKASGSTIYKEATKELEEQAFPFMPLRATETSWATKVMLDYCWRPRIVSKRGKKGQEDYDSVNSNSRASSNVRQQNDEPNGTKDSDEDDDDESDDDGAFKIVDTGSITHDTSTGLHMAPPVTKQTADKRKNGTKNKHKQGTGKVQKKATSTNSREQEATKEARSTKRRRGGGKA